MAAKLSALYYPHISIENEGLLKNALFLWDQIELICPFGAFPNSPGGEKQAAFETLARPLRPSDQEMRDAHEAILEIANSDLPDWFFPERVNTELHYYIYPQKFLPETWEELQRSKLAQPVLTDIEPPMPAYHIKKEYEKAKERAFQTTQAFGLTMLSILADCCGGTQKQLITDEIDSYVALDRYLKLIGGSKKLPMWKSEKSSDRLVTLSVQAVDVSNVSLSSLVKMREREHVEPRLRSMRHNYVNKLDTYVARLSKEARSARDVEEIERAFHEEIVDDVGLLRDELKDEGKKAIFSNALLGVAAIATAGTFVPASTPLLAAAAVYRTKVEYRAARNKALEKHAMSWLYEMKGPKLF